MNIYHMPGTRSSRVVWTAHEVGANVDTTPIDLQKGEGQSPEHKARHPHGKVPAVVVDGVNLIESGAIALHLAYRHKANSTFLPNLGSIEGAKVLQWAFYAPATIDDLTIDAFLQQFAPEDKRDNALVERAASMWKNTIGPFLTRELGKGPYLLGENFTFADVMIGYTVYYADKMGWVDGALKSYVGRISDRPAFQKAFAR